MEKQEKLPLGPTTPILDGTKVIAEKETEPERETWGKKIDFLLSVVGFAVDLGNVWRFPYICYKNGGGAFMIPYVVMLLFGGLPLFYMELALGQYQRCGCLTVWDRICPAFKGIGLAICVIATYVAWYYNTIIAWAVFYFFSAWRAEVPWRTCNNPWNNNETCTIYERLLMGNTTKLYSNASNMANLTTTTMAASTGPAIIRKSPTEEFFEYEVLGLQHASGLEDVGGVNWILCLCLLGVFVLVYFAMWKGVKSSGKAVWVTATMPYVVLLILLVRGCMLEGADRGIFYYIRPVWSKLGDKSIWISAAAQVFFSLGPGFGVLLALSSYNKLNNNCYKDALITSGINCATSFLAGFAVFSVLGHMSFVQDRPVEDVARDDVGLIFIVYPEAISSLNFSTFWALLFFFMLITLGLDTTFGGLESLCTGILDEYVVLRKNRKLFVLALMAYCFIGALATTTYGGIYVVQLLDSFGAPIAIIFVVFLEAVAVSWIYGVNRFCDDIESMLGFRPGIYWRVCWSIISPFFLLILFILSLIDPMPPQYGSYDFPQWSFILGWIIVCSSLICIPGYMIYKFFRTPGSIRQRILVMFTPTDVPSHARKPALPAYV
ncbi:sodium-dependent serotonin transporter-like [Mizuhopecten yessoensis]|uniref:Transporter n=1 Tax=Mizuhopecten yessoensis TaxID=6573 RepID=A0A210QTZ4_MIZYE|nr:sodium-dependent serotonin transporter-like [Mizuhopecten yessoensis]OWF52218.1 Sodium-dependent serotonin transporter [Mizuhopecten yessoensis]